MDWSENGDTNENQRRPSGIKIKDDEALIGPPMIRYASSALASSHWFAAEIGS